MTSVGAVGALVEKVTENGDLSTTATPDSQKDDYDAYALYGVTKVGDFTIEPLLFYHVDSAFYRVANSALTYDALDQGSDGVKVLYFALASRGKVGSLGMEAELGYISRDASNIRYTLLTGQAAPNDKVVAYFDNDWKEYGAYLGIWNDMDFGRIGAKLAYGSYDEDGGMKNPLTGKFSGAGFDFREDFKSNLILGDEKSFGTGSTNEDLTAMTLIQPYIKGVKLGMDKLTGSLSFGYMMSNSKENLLEGASAWETDLGVQYKLSDNLLYKVDAGYASISYDKDNNPAKDPDAIMCLKHEILLTF
jgi:hypothetical protein